MHVCEPTAQDAGTMEHKETSELFRSPLEVQCPRLGNGGISTLSLLDLNDNLNCWDDCDSEISILSELVSPETDDGHSNLSSDSFTELATYMNEDYHKQAKETFRSGAQNDNTMHDVQSAITTHLYQPRIISQDMFESNTVPSLSKNAIAARENRLKKKKYVENLERSFETLNDENVDLKIKVESYEGTITQLNAEVAYLKNVIANQSTLSALLQNIQSTPGVKFKTSIQSTSSSNIPVRSSSTSKGNSQADNQENICNNLRRSKRKCPVSSSECEKKVKRVFSKSNSIIATDSSHDMTSIHDGLSPESEQMSITKMMNKSLSCVDKSAEDMDKSRISSTQRLNGGVCLHVTGETVSIEFCQQCNKNSQSELAYNDHSYFRLSHDS